MLFKRCVVKPSSIHGLGLFADEDIAAGETISLWVDGFDRVFTAEQFAALPRHARTHVELYGFRRQDGSFLIEIDGGRYVNHSETPNVRVLDDAGCSSVAARDIKAGEELTERYEEFDRRGFRP